VDADPSQRARLKGLALGRGERQKRLPELMEGLGAPVLPKSPILDEAVTEVLAVRLQPIPHLRRGEMERRRSVGSVDAQRRTILPVIAVWVPYRERAVHASVQHHAWIAGARVLQRPGLSLKIVRAAVFDRSALAAVAKEDQRLACRIAVRS